MVDLTSLGVVTAAERGADLTMTHPATQEPTDLIITVMGFDAEPVVQSARSFDREEARKPQDQREPDPILRRNIALATAAVTGWKNLAMGGKEVKFSAAKAAEILADPNYVFIVHQVCAFGGQRRNFFPKASPK